METKKTANKDLKKAKQRPDIIKRNIEAAKISRNKSKENKKPVLDKKPARAKSEKNLKEKQPKPIKTQEPVDVLGIKSPVPIRSSPEKAKNESTGKEAGNKFERIEDFEIKLDIVTTEQDTEDTKDEGFVEKTPFKEGDEGKVMPKASSHKRRRDSNEEIEGIEKTIKYSQ